MRRNAFTLVELLVVLLVIAVLLGLLIPAVGLVRERMRRAQAVTQIAKMETALKLFKDVNGFYPESGMKSGITNANDFADNLGRLRDALITVDRDLTQRTNGKDPFVDPWGQPLRYRPAKQYPFTAGLANHAINSDDPPSPDSYQLWSLGSNGRDDSLAGTDTRYGDDVVSWKLK